MPTKAWMVYGESGDTLIINRTAKGAVRMRLVQGEHVTSAVLPYTEFLDALIAFGSHEEACHAAVNVETGDAD